MLRNILSKYVRIHMYVCVREAYACYAGKQISSSPSLSFFSCRRTCDVNAELDGGR